MRITATLGGGFTITARLRLLEGRIMHATVDLEGTVYTGEARLHPSDVPDWPYARRLAILRAVRYHEPEPVTAGRVLHPKSEAGRVLFAALWRREQPALRMVHRAGEEALYSTWTGSLRALQAAARVLIGRGLGVSVGRDSTLAPGAWVTWLSEAEENVLEQAGLRMLALPLSPAFTLVKTGRLFLRGTVETGRLSSQEPNPLLGAPVFYGTHPDAPDELRAPVSRRITDHAFEPACPSCRDTYCIPGLDRCHHLTPEAVVTEDLTTGWCRGLREEHSR